MEQVVLIDQYQKVSTEDFNNFGLYPRKTIDDIGKGLLIPDAAFWGFPVVNPSPTSLLVGAGHLIRNGEIYFNEDQGGVELDLLPYLPAATRRVVTVAVWGQTIETSSEPRTFLIDPVTRATEARVVSTESRRRAEISLVAGTVAPDPLPPAMPSDTLAVANVLIDTTGVVSITTLEDNRAPSIRSLNTMAKAFDLWRQQIAALVDTLQSDLANLAGRIGSLAERNMVLDIAADLARAKFRIGLPAQYTAWAADEFMTTAYSDPTHVDWLASIEEGARFPYAQQREAQIVRLNPLDAGSVVQDNMCLPVYDNEVRHSLVANDQEVSISQSATYSSTTAWTNDYSRELTRYGYQYTTSQSRSTSRYETRQSWPQMFGLGGEVVSTGETHAVQNWYYRTDGYWADGTLVADHYWSAVTSSLPILGAIVAQTFLQAQEGWLTAVDLYFTRKAATGDSTVLITKTLDNGTPDLNAVIAAASFTPNDINIYPTATRLMFRPTALSPGKRYAVVVVTPGNHYLAAANKNKYANGSMFVSTDAGWFEGSTTWDLSMQLVFARFRKARTEVALEPLQLENGIHSVSILSKMVTPEGEGFGVTWEVQIAGIWTPLNDANRNAFVGLPALLPLRAVLTGSLSMMPGFGVGPNSKLLTFRPRSDFRHISEPRIMPGAGTINTVYVDLRIEKWRGDPHHACTITLGYGANYETIKTADAVQDEAAPDDPNALLRRAVFSFPAPITGYQIRVDGTTDNVVTCFYLSSRRDVAFTL
jgi:hypothetical protein